jgi:hypothetical protein
MNVATLLAIEIQTVSALAAIALPLLNFVVSAAVRAAGALILSDRYQRQ